LNGDATDHRERKDPRSSPPQLVVTREGKLDRDSETLDRHDGNRSDEGANGDVHEGVRVAVLGSDLVDHVEGEDEDEEAVEHEPWTERGSDSSVEEKKESDEPGCRAYSRISSTEEISLSSGA
jgi:hypothetical protein